MSLTSLHPWVSSCQVTTLKDSFSIHLSLTHPVYHSFWVFPGSRGITHTWTGIQDVFLGEVLRVTHIVSYLLFPMSLPLSGVPAAYLDLNEVFSKARSHPRLLTDHTTAPSTSSLGLHLLRATFTRCLLRRWKPWKPDIIGHSSSPTGAEFFPPNFGLHDAPV